MALSWWRFVLPLIVCFWLFSLVALFGLFWCVPVLVCGVRGYLVGCGAFRGSGALFSVFSCLVLFGLVCGMPFLARFRAFFVVFCAFVGVCLSLVV